MGTPLSSYSDSDPMDSFGQLTNWPDEPDFKDIDLSKQTRELSVPPVGTTISYYQFAGRLISGKLKVDEHKITPAALLNLKEWDDNSGYGCTDNTGGETILPGNMPVEFVFWQALDDMFRNSALLPKEKVDKKSIGKTYYNIKNQKKTYRGRQISEWIDTISELMVFRVNRHLKCQSQKKIFKLVVQDMSQSITTTDRFKWNNTDTLGLNGNARGEFSAEMTGTGGEQIIYILKIHIGMDIDALYGNGDTYEWVLQCQSDIPIFASRVKGLHFSLQTGENNWIGMICGK